MKDITFCVNREELTDDQVVQLYGWCLEVGAEDETLNTWLELEYEYRYLGLDTYGETYSSTEYHRQSTFNNNVLRFLDVRSFLGLKPLLDTSEDSTEPPQQDLRDTADDCMSVEGSTLQEPVHTQQEVIGMYTRKTLQNTLGEVESLAHAEYIIKVCEDAGFKYSSSVATEASKSFMIYDNRFGIYGKHYSELSNAGMRKKITIQLPLKYECMVPSNSVEGDPDKPALGLLPNKQWLILRQYDIVRALQRQVDACEELNTDWIKELTELNNQIKHK